MIDRILVVIGTIATVPGGWGNEKPEYAPQQVAYLQTEYFEKPLHVWLPKNYDASKKWPVMFYYHGTGGQPTIEYLRMYTSGEDWILIGMTYLDKGQFQYSEERLEKELGILYEIRGMVMRDVALDPTRTYVSGFSKGGWVAGLFLQQDPKLAGGMILGAGTFTDGITDHPKKLYIGIGEDDPNLAMSFRARREFSVNRGSEITFEIWPGIGHKFPLNKLTPVSEAMKQWLKVEGRAADQGDAIEWMEKELLEIQRSDTLNAFQKLEAVERMEQSPFAKLLDGEGTEALTEAKATFRANPDVGPELRARTVFFKIVEHESRDRYVSTLAECNAQYSRLASAFPQSEYGKHAAKAVERISKTLGGTP